MTDDRHTHRVLQVLHDDRGPFRRIAAQYCQMFRAPGDRVAVTTVFLRGDARQDTSGYGDEVHFFCGMDRRLDGLKLDLLLRLIRLCRNRHFDLVIGHRYKTVYLLGLASCFVRMPLIFGVLHGPGILRRRLRRLLLRCRPKLRLIAVSEFVRTDLLTQCPELADRVARLANAIDPAVTAARLPRRQARARLGLAERELLVGSVGRFVKKKCYPLLLEAFALCLAELPELPLRLVLIGDGPERARLEHLSAQLGLQDRVTLTGWVEHADLLMPALDVFVMPSGGHEAFGRVLIEAMAVSLPVVCSNVAGPAEVVGEAGWQFREGDARSLADCLRELLGQLAGDDASRLEARVSLASRRLAERYSLAVVRDEFRNWPPVREAIPFSQ